MWSRAKLRARAGALLLSLGGAAALRGEVKVGDAFPPLRAGELSDGALPQTTGNVVLVDFWASWCAPCRASFPAYARLYHDFSAKGLVIVAVSVDESFADYAGFLRQLAPPFATVRDDDQRLVGAVDVPAMPTSYLMGRDGVVHFIHVGFHGADTERALRAEITQLLAP